jgi:mono/diheme cytochrome c family protein
MSLRQLNLLLLFAFAGCLSLNWMLARDRSRPNADFLPGMSEPITYSAFSANPNFPDGKTLREPAPGTIARGHLPLHYRSTTEDAIRAGQELHNPFDDTDAQVRERGAYVFANYCQVCHGPQGKGDGPVSQRGVPPPPSLRESKSKDMKDGQLFHILTYGQGNMPSYAAQLSREDRWRVIVRVRSLQKASPANGEKSP